ncbi:MAG: hypothetical protein WCA19_01910 [Candidatus Acidiferrales bacterium]
MKRFAAIAAMVLFVTSMTVAKKKDIDPADYPLTAVVVSVTAPNTESAFAVGTTSYGNSTAQAFSSTAARAEIQIGSTIYLVGLIHECGNCIHRKHIDLSAGDTLHAQFTKDNQRIEILNDKNGKTMIDTFDVKGSRLVGK